MTHPLSRRRFLKHMTAAGGAALLGPTIAGAKGAGQRPLGKSRAEAIDAKKTTADGVKRRVKAKARYLAPVDVRQNEKRLLDYQTLTRQPIFKTQITPHWSKDSARFWYRNALAHGQQEFILVDTAHGRRAPAFDHAKLAVGLSRASGQPYTASQLPFEFIEYTDDAQTVRFTVDDLLWQCDLTSYACTKSSGSTPAPDKSPQPEKTEEAPEVRPAGVSPDGQWTVVVREHNLFVGAKGRGTETALTHDGTAERPYGEIDWSPASKAFVAYRIAPVPIKPVYMVEASPRDGGTRGVLHQHEYAQPGDPFSQYEMWLFDPAEATATKAQVETIDFGDAPSLRWAADGRSFTFERMDRGYQRFRVIAVEVGTGQSTTLVDDQATTFIDSTTTYVHHIDDGAEILYASERDGWRHLYLFNGRTGALKNRITQGPWVVRDVNHLDEAARQIWFTASGKNHGEDPYHLHSYRINFDGTGLVTLTEGDGSHTVQYSPDRKHLIDTYSRADLPPVHTLRRESDGGHVCDLERADISALTAGGWQMPEVFTAPGRDGKTGIWGVVFKPTHFDPTRKYPIIENIYAGPQDSFVRKTFAVPDEMQSLAELGFIVVQCDGMGTRNRSKAFHDVCWRNLKDAGLPDRIAWIRALAARDPQADTGRVGIYGTSAGGQSSTGALLFHPEFYKVAVSSCGCHDNRIDKQWWNEQWMGYPIGPWYADNSNITHAVNLRGRLLLIVGELDSNVPPESTLRLTDALMKAGKDFDLLVITGSDHTSGGLYGERRRRDYFIRHLLGVEPPDRNAPAPPVKPVLLTPRPLSEMGQAQPVGGDETSIQFHNRTAQTVELFWLPGDGTRKSYGTIAAGGTRDMHTFAGHWWLIVGPDGKPIALYVGESRPGIVEIRE